MRPGARAGAIAAVFVVNGAGGPGILPRLPERQAALGLSDAGLGLVLVGLAGGAMLASPVAGRLVETVGSRRLVVAAALVLGASLWTAGAAPTPLLLALALAVIGAADATMDIAMNANAGAYELRTGRSVMHRLHGAWSLGAVAGTLVAAGCAAPGIPLSLQLAAMGTIGAATVLAARHGLVATPPPRPEPASDGLSSPTADIRGQRRQTVLLVLAAATVGGAVLEGAPTDWSALRLERLGTGPGVAALGVVAFMAGLLAGRAVGDHLTDRFGGPAVLRGGMAVVAAGLGLGIVVDHPVAFVAGLVLAGAGTSGFFPLAFSAAARLPGVSAGAGAATVSVAARLGFLLEPPAMGALSEAVGLRWAFAAVAAVAVAVAVLGPRIIPAGTGTAPAPVADVRSW